MIPMGQGQLTQESLIELQICVHTMHGANVGSAVLQAST
jgi:hypothetical protein